MFWHWCGQWDRDECRNLTGSGYRLRDQRAACAALMFFEPAVQDIGVHPMLSRQCCDRHTCLLASSYQFGFELRRVGPVGASG